MDFSGNCKSICRPSNFIRVSCQALKIFLDTGSLCCQVTFLHLNQIHADDPLPQFTDYLCGTESARTRPELRIRDVRVHLGCTGVQSLHNRFYPVNKAKAQPGLEQTLADDMEIQNGPSPKQISI